MSKPQMVQYKIQHLNTWNKNKYFLFQMSWEQICLQGEMQKSISGLPCGYFQSLCIRKSQQPSCFCLLGVRTRPTAAPQHASAASDWVKLIDNLHASLIVQWECYKGSYYLFVAVIYFLIISVSPLTGIYPDSIFQTSPPFYIIFQTIFQSL